MAYTLLWFQTRKIYISQQILKRIRWPLEWIHSGGSNNLNRIKIDPRTGKKLSLNVDIVAATALNGQEVSRF